jgi:hypothetical protein
MHIFRAGDTPVFVKRALANRKKSLALNEEGPAVNHFFRQAELFNLRICAC